MRFDHSDENYVLAADLGTSGCKAAVVSAQGQVLGWAFRPVQTHVIGHTGAEQVPEDWWTAFLASAAEALSAAKVPANRVVAVCSSTQGEGTIAVDRDGRPLMNALTWMDMRGAENLRRTMTGPIRLAGYDLFRLMRWIRLCGGAPALSGKDPAAHMLLIRDRFPEIYARTYKFLNVLDYFNLRLTGRMVATQDSILTSWVTDNRCVDRVRYHPALIAASGIDADKFPELVRCTDVIGTLLPEIAAQLGLDPATPVVAGAIDNTAAAIGAGTLRDYDAHLYIGTSSWIGAHVPHKKTDLFGQIASVPCALPSRYLMVALQSSGGNNISFLKERILFHDDGLHDTEPSPGLYQELDRIVASVPAGSDGLIYTPWLFGERCPVDDRALRAGLFNLSMDHSRETIIRAFFEGTALNTRWMLKPVERFLGRPLPRITLLGGGALSTVWCQIYADILGVPVRRLAEPIRANALGAAIIARVGLGLTDFEQAAQTIRIDAEYQPNPAHRQLYDDRFASFTELYRRLGPIYRRLQRKEKQP